MKSASVRVEFFTIFDRVPKWFSWGLLVEWFDGKGYHAEWLEQCTLGLDGADEYEVLAYSGTNSGATRCYAPSAQGIQVRA